MKLSVVIPVYNEEKTLENIVEEVQSLDVEKEIILVDDFSKDKSREIEDKLEKKYKNLSVYKQPENRGKGAALRVGFKHAKGEYVVVQDADLEYDPKDILKLLEVMEEGRDEKKVVYGSRFLGEERISMTFTHTLGNKMLTILTNVLYNTWITDMETCYKLFPRELIQSIEYHSNRFNFEPEITAKILKRGYRIYEVPIKYFGRDWKEGKHISWKDGFAAIWALVKYRFVD